MALHVPHVIILLLARRAHQGDLLIVLNARRDIICQMAIVPRVIIPRAPRVRQGDLLTA